MPRKIPGKPLVNLLISKHEALAELPVDVQPHRRWMQIAGFAIPNRVIDVYSRPLYHPKIAIVLGLLVLRTIAFVWSVGVFIRDPNDAFSACLSGDWTWFIGPQRHVVLMPYTLASILTVAFYLSWTINHRNYDRFRWLHVQLLERRKNLRGLSCQSLVKLWKIGILLNHLTEYSIRYTVFGAMVIWVIIYLVFLPPQFWYLSLFWSIFTSLYLVCLSSVGFISASQVAFSIFYCIQLLNQYRLKVDGILMGTLAKDYKGTAIIDRQTDGAQVERWAASRGPSNLT